MVMTRRGLLLVCLGALLPVCSHASVWASQANADVVAVIAGRVIAEGVATPLRRARVEAMVDGRYSVPVFSDDRGRFEIQVPAATVYALRVTKPGYAPMEIARPGAVASDPQPLVVSLAPGAAITGQLLDSLGDPAVGITVRIQRLRDARERPGTNQGAPPSAEVALELFTATDDLGEFRAGSLAAGRYRVVADAPLMSPPSPVTSETLFPSRPSSSYIMSAVPVTGSAIANAYVTLGAGEESEVTLAFELGPQPIRNAAAYVEGFEAGARARPEADLERVVADAGRSSRARNTGSIRGRITNHNSRPVPGAFIQLIALGARNVTRMASSDAQGLYEIAGLAPGNFRMRVSKPGFIQVEYGQKRALQQGRTISVGDGQRLERVDVGLPRGGVITGRVVDEAGEVIEGLAVQAWERRFIGGRAVVAPANGILTGRTDDRGIYRLHGLLPGSYYVVASESAGLNSSGRSPPPPPVIARLPFSIPGTTEGPRVYHPGSQRIAEAAMVEVDGNIQMFRADLALRPVATARVTGTVLNSSGNPAGTAQVLLFPSFQSGAPLVQPHHAVVARDGTFEALHVPPGEYVVQAILTALMGSTASEPGSITVTTWRRVGGEFGMQLVTVVDADVGPISIRTSPGSAVAGRVTLVGAASSLAPSAVRLTALPADFDRSPLAGTQSAVLQSTIRPDWTFELSSVFGPTRLALSAPDEWYLKSVTVDGIDAAEEPFTFDATGSSRSNMEVVISGGAASVSGRVLDDRKQSVSDYSVIVFSADPQRWYYRSQHVKLARSGLDGTFKVAGLPPGEYWIAAVDFVAGDVEFGEWQNPDVLIGLTSSAQRLTLKEGGRAATDLRLTRLAR